MKEKIIIIGGGISGLSAAERLCGKYDITVLEKDDILGGLAKSFYYGNKWIPMTYHHVQKVDEMTVKYIKKYNLEKYLRWNNIAMAFWFDGKGYPLTEPRHILSFKPFNFIDKINLAKLGIYCRFKGDWSSFRGKRADIWLDKFAGKNVRMVLFENLARIKFGDLSAVDMAWLGARLHEAAKNREKYAYLACGVHNLVTELEKEIKSKGGKIRTGAEVIRIGRKTIEAKINGRKTTFGYDKIISSIPPEILARISNLPEKTKKELMKVKYHSVICLVAGSKDLISRHYWNIFIRPKLSFGGIFNHTALYPEGGINGEHLYYFFVYTGRDDRLFHLSENEIKQRFLDDAIKICPKFRFSWTKIFKIKYATPFFSLNYKNLPLKISENVYLTGDYREHPSTRTMHTAFKSGNKTAEFILSGK